MATLDDHFEIRWSKNLKYNKEWRFMCKKKNNENFTNIVSQLNTQTSKDDTLFWREWKYYPICALNVLNMIHG